MDKRIRPSWDEYFMTMAVVASSRATCRHVKAGCVIVLDKRIIGTGYNGAPPRIINCLEAGCRKENLGFEYKGSLNKGLCIGVHAEMNALANITRNISKGATVYISIFPCMACAKNLLAYNVSRIVYRREYDKEEAERARRLLKEAGVILEQLDISAEKIINIIFNSPKVDFDTFSEEEKAKILDKI